MKNLFVLLLTTFISQAQNIGRFISVTENEAKVGDSLIIYPLLQFSGSLKNIAEQPILDLLAQFLKTNSNVIVELQMHNDSRAGIEYNLVFTQKRADSLAAFIVRKGIDSHRIIPVGKGECCPLYKDELIDSKTNEEEREALFGMNRRVVIKVVRLE